MPRKKKSELLEVSEAEPVVVKEEKKLCGHENKHAYGTNGKLEPLFCDLPKGHQGDHHARFQRNEPERTTNEKGMVVKVEFKAVEDDAYWNDAAGKPVSDIPEGSAIQMTQYQQDLVMEVMKKNPALTARQALAAAKELEAWR